MATATLLADALQGRERDKPSVIAFTRDGIENLQQINADQRFAGHAPPKLGSSE